MKRAQAKTGEVTAGDPSLEGKSANGSTKRVEVERAGNYSYYYENH